MSDMIESPKIINLTNRTKTQKNGSTLQLTFHIPDGMRVKADVVLELSKVVNSSLSIKNEPVVELGKPEILVVHEAPEAAVPLESQSVAADLIAPAAAEVKIHINELANDVIPFFSLKLKNSASVYKIGTSYLKDIANGQKHFGFVSMSKQLDDLPLLVYASFINYSLKKPVLIVVKDINDKAFDKFRANFTKGTLWKWQTNDWGNLCFIDYKQINKYTEELKQLDLSFITDEFVSVLWALPSGNVQDELQKSSLNIISKISSVTFVICKGETKNNDFKKSAAYYQCFDIAIKGILIGENLK